MLSFKEIPLQQHLKELYRSMEPTYIVEVTQGPKELGKDLVLVKSDHVTTDVIGVVVKCGDVKGKTLGEVDDILADIDDTFLFKGNRKFDEVLSQVKQAIKHDAEIGASVQKYPVNKVIVLIAGNVSSEGRTRIVAEVEDRVDQVRGIDWLVERFTDYYPEIFFEGHITSFIEKKIEELEHRHIALRTNKGLSECFVDPVIQTADVAIDLKKGINAFIDRKKLPFSSLDSVLVGKKRVLIVGDPGTGKSAAVAKLTIDALGDLFASATRREYRPDKLRVPVLVTALQIQASSSANEVLTNYFGEYEIVDQIEVRVLIVDGLDEVRSDSREAVIERAVEFAEEMSAPLIITSRNIDTIKTAPTGFSKYELLPFGAGQALSLIKKINSQKDVVAVLREGLERIKHQIPMVPLSLILLIELVEEHKEIPASITELYDRFSDSTLGKEDKNKGIEVLFEYRIKKRFLAELALKLFVEPGRIEVPVEDFQEFSQKYADRFTFGEGELDRFILDIERAGILCIGDENVLFRHRSFLDYFGAIQIDAIREELPNLNDYVANLYFRDDGGEAAFFYIGLRREIRQNLLDRLFSEPDSSFGIELGKVSVGHLLQAGWHSETPIQREGLTRAFDYVKTVRPKLLEFAKQDKWKQPALLTDVILLSACEISFRSGFLAKELREMLEQSPSTGQAPDLFSRLALVWVLRPFLSVTELHDEIDLMTSWLDTSTELTGDEKVELALLVSILDERKAVFTKAMKDKVKKIYGRHSVELYRLLPPKEKRRRYQPPAR